jgi:predicted O-methyltransferase YrrM
VLDDHVREVLARLEAEDVADRAAGLPSLERSLPVGPEAGAVLCSLAASAGGCRALEIGASRGYSTLWIAAGARIRGGTVVSLEQDPAKIKAWHRNVADAGLAAVARLVEGDARETVTGLGPFDLVLLDAWKRDYEDLFQLVRPLVVPGGSIVADNVCDHAEELADYVAARRADATLSTVTVPVGNGLELSTVLV